MRRRWILAVVMALTGLTFIGQGLGIVRGSSTMVDDSRWAIVGIVLVGAGLFVGWATFRKGRRA